MIGARPKCRRGGSVLVPVVAAMLILLLSGVALSELFAAQRVQSVLGVESTRSFWIAEAGLWLAAYEEADISPAESFAGGTYAVAKSDDDYTSTGTLDLATRVVAQTLAPPDGVHGNPLDEAASEATAYKQDDKKFRLDLVSQVPYWATVASLELSASRSTEPLRKFKIDTKEVFKNDAGEALPTGELTANQGNVWERSVDPDVALEAEVEFLDNLSAGSITFTLVLHFTDETSSTLTFTLTW